MNTAYNKEEIPSAVLGSSVLNIFKPYFVSVSCTWLSCPWQIWCAPLLSFT